MSNSLKDFNHSMERETGLKKLCAVSDEFSGKGAFMSLLHSRKLRLHPVLAFQEITKR